MKQISNYATVAPVHWVFLMNLIANSLINFKINHSRNEYKPDNVNQVIIFCFEAIMIKTRSNILIKPNN